MDALEELAQFLHSCERVEFRSGAVQWRLGGSMVARYSQVLELVVFTEGVREMFNLDPLSNTGALTRYLLENG